GLAGHGIIADIPSPHRDKPFIALRADMDALPIKEETGHPFSSQKKGVMHACGHDGHMAALLGAAELLLQEDRSYPVRLLFQPAEEIGAGAKEMIQAGALNDVAVIFGGHVDLFYRTGTMVATSGPLGASTDEFTIIIKGRGGHGARPHESVDAVVVGSLMVMAIQTLVSREIDPASPSVVSVGRFHAGTKSNVIAGQALLSGTIRAQKQEVRTHLREGIARIAKSVGELHGATIEIDFREGTPPLVNPEDMAEIAHAAAAEVVGEHNVVKPRVVNMGGEDFSFYMKEVPGCYVRYGAQCPGKRSFPAHSSKFDFDEKVLPIAAQYLSTVALKAMEWLNEKNS
ncbi:MAG: amidohydrolase, partial [Bdellovibrionales bacterium]|nr:amidohydrolase [Bdellovibrionales bacterium]